MNVSPDSRQHWEALYAAKQPHEMSWTQPVPATSLAFIQALALPRHAPILDVGGGDSRLVDFLLADGYQDLTVLDISGRALANVRQRLGAAGQAVHWLEADIRTVEPDRRYALWHDRAAFHFLINPAEVGRYLETARQALLPGGYLVLGAFALDGPGRCSGLPVRQYNEASLTAQMPAGFARLRCQSAVHTTPFDTNQPFVFCAFRRLDEPLAS
ncbi:class I SAM-dependent methyltransferase [Hymenobacter mucosus]|uniref:Methyltransferase domain-containing protein n=1 Tax=Hymenobacter mucosus TaxID=1411120 RepID=A0A238ZZV3_9BACT|nr:class I SAM-dependent methyltransferase [Hymenobacter mucosus]SNR88304.1 Methyltransferase domain-containing protein [Hymenobacter mucosus]